MAQLKWLGDRIGHQLLDAVIITTGTEAYRRQDGIAVVPAGSRQQRSWVRSYRHR